MMPTRALVRLLALYAALPQSAVAAAVEDIVNYREYSAQLSSAGQPTADQLAAVGRAGFERVVYLAFSDNEHSLPNQDRLVKELGMEYVHIPVDWDAPSKSDFYLFAGALQRAPAAKTLVHCQANFRATAFSFLYQVLYLDVPITEAKDAMNSVWVPNATWRNLIFEVLEDNGIDPDCDGCLWE